MKIIESIVDSYDIPGKAKSRIVSIARENLERRGVNDYSEMYSYIDFLVERFTSPYEERFFTRLDHPEFEDSDTTPHELLILPNSLKGDSQRDLKERLKGVKEVLGRPIIQREPIIRLGRRTYNGNPIDLFRAHEEFYGGKSRTQLFEFDAGMYESLRRHNQLHIAIPEIRDTRFKGISGEKEREILETFRTVKSPTTIARMLNVSRATVDFYLIEKHGLRKLNERTGNPGYSQVMINDMVDCLRKCKKVSKVAECYGVSRWTVTKHAREVGVPILSRGGDITNIPLKYRGVNQR